MMSKTIVLKSCADCALFRKDDEGWTVGVCRHPKAQIPGQLLQSRQINTELSVMPFPSFCPL